MWADQEVQPGDTINVVSGRQLASPTCSTLEVTGTEGLLILHPDVLLSGKLRTSSPCMHLPESFVPHLGGAICS